MTGLETEYRKEYTPGLDSNIISVRSDRLRREFGLLFFLRGVRGF
jgi:hypothetical protein